MEPGRDGKDQKDSEEQGAVLTSVGRKWLHTSFHPCLSNSKNIRHKLDYLITIIFDSERTKRERCITMMGRKEVLGNRKPILCSLLRCICPLLCLQSVKFRINDCQEAVTS